MTLQEFEAAKTRLASLKADPGNEAKLKLYALFKQVTVGKCNTRKPGMMDLVGKAKWSAWNELGDMDKNSAEAKYIEFVDELYKAENPGEMSRSGSKKVFTTILTSVEFGNIYMVRMNRPKKYNALNQEMYEEIVEALQEAENDPKIVAFCITGNGPYYSSGNDLSNFSKFEGDPASKIKEGCDFCGKFVSAFINCSKPLIALVNGPVVGISFSVLGMFDIVIASDKATFWAPFTVKALSPEGCSSFTFPKIMGPIRAADVLLFNKKLSAKEAFEYGLLTEVVGDQSFEAKTRERLETVSKLPRESLNVSRNFMRAMDKEQLLKVNKQEMEMLAGRFSSGEFMQSVMEFMSKRSKL